MIKSMYVSLDKLTPKYIFTNSAFKLESVGPKLVKSDETTNFTKISKYLKIHFNSEVE